MMLSELSHYHMCTSAITWTAITSLLWQHNGSRVTSNKWQSHFDNNDQLATIVEASYPEQLIDKLNASHLGSVTAPQVFFSDNPSVSSIAVIVTGWRAIKQG